MSENENSTRASFRKIPPALFDVDYWLLNIDQLDWVYDFIFYEIQMRTKTTETLLLILVISGVDTLAFNVLFCKYFGWILIHFAPNCWFLFFIHSIL